MHIVKRSSHHRSITFIEKTLFCGFVNIELDGHEVCLGFEVVQYIRQHPLADMVRRIASNDFSQYLFHENLYRC